MNRLKISFRLPDLFHRGLSFSEWLSLIFLVLLLLLLPLSFAAALKPVQLFKKAASPATLPFPITPTPSCKTGVNQFAVNTRCGITQNKYRFATFSCYDGFRGRLGDSDQCKKSKYWHNQAEKICQDHPACPVATPTPTPASPVMIQYCNPRDQGVISVRYYNRSDGLPGMKVNVSANTEYLNPALEITQEGADGMFLGDKPTIGYSDKPYYYSWLWDTVRPVSERFKVTFYINHTPQQNGEPCGEYYTYTPPFLTPTPTRPTPTLPPPPNCKTGVNSFSVIMACSTTEFRFATFSCYDGYEGKLGSSDSCKSPAVWKRYVEEECKKHPLCGPTPTATPSFGLIPCTADAKLCPDGSYVGRTGPNCEFAPCPTNSTPTPVFISPTQTPTPKPITP